MEWPTKAAFIPAGETGQMTYLRGAGIISWQVTPIFSIAAGPNLNYSEVDLKEYPGFVNHFRGRATDAGYTAGLLFHPGDEHYFGLTYRSATEMNYNGHATLLAPPFAANTAASADFHFPCTLAAGYSFRPNEKWNFEGDVNWTDWSSLKTVSVQPEPVPESLAFNWQPSWMLDLGVTRYLRGRLAGQRRLHVQHELGARQARLIRLVPDSDRHIFSVGVGKKYKKIQLGCGLSIGLGAAAHR